MQRRSWRTPKGSLNQRNAGSTKWIRRVASALLAGLLLAQFGCLFRHKAPAAAVTPPAPIRIALLPLNTPPDTPDNRWLSLAAPVLLAQAGENAPDLEIIPIWESMPITIQALGTSRSIGPEQAAYIAGLLTAKWAVAGEFTIGKDAVTVLIDFIPSKETMIPFRYEKATQINALQANVREAMAQFLRYVVARPVTAEPPAQDVNTLRGIAQALDLEYGWFAANSEPGKAEQIVSGLGKADIRLAQFLFNPNLYPVISRGEKKPEVPTPATPAKPSSPDLRK